MRPCVLVFACSLVSACTGDSGIGFADLADATVDLGAPGAPGTPDGGWGDLAGHDRGQACTGERPACISDCTSDWDTPQPAFCDDGTWRCSVGDKFLSDCPPGVCKGEPFPGDRCVDGNWTCDLSQASLDDFCVTWPCRSCDGFTGPQHFGNCSCQCEPTDEDFATGGWAVHCLLDLR